MTPFGPLPLPARMSTRQPDWTLVPFVRAAIACGATYLHIQGSREDLCLTWDGSPLSEADKLLLPGRSLAPAEEFLRTGLYRLWQGEAVVLTYEGRGVHDHLQWKITASRASCKSLKGTTELPAHRVRRTRRKRWHELFRSEVVPERFAEELKVLRDVCRYAPLQLKIDQEIISAPVTPGPCLLQLVIDPPEAVEPLNLVDPSFSKGLRASTPLPYSAVLAVGGQNPNLQPLNLLRNGVLLKWEEPRLQSLGIRCILRCDALSMGDENQPLRDHLYTAVLSDLIEHSLGFGEQLCRHYPATSGLKRIEASIHIKQYAELAERLGQAAAAERWLRSLLEAQNCRSEDAAETLLRLGLLQLQQGRSAEARQSFQQSLEAGGDGYNAIALAHLAKLELKADQLPAAEEYARLCLAQERARWDPFDPRLSDACRLLARILQSAQPVSEERIREVDQLYLESLRILEQHHGSQHLTLADVLLELAAHRFEQSRYRECEPLLKRALQIRQQALGQESLDAAEVLDLLGALHEEKGRPGAAGKAYSQALAIYELHHGPQTPQVQKRLSELACFYRIHGKFELAEPIYRRLLLQAPGDPGASQERAQRYCELATLLQTRGEHTQAEQGFLQALELWKLDPANQGNYAWTLDRLGELFIERGKFKEALSRLSLARSIWLRVLGKGHPDLSVNLEIQARAWIGLGNWPQAERFLRRALELKERSVGPGHRVCVRLLGSLAEVLKRAGKVDQATELFRKIELSRQSGSVLTRQPSSQRLCSRYGLAEVPAWSFLAKASELGLRGKFKQLRPLCLAALRAREQALGPSHPDVSYLLEDMAALYTENGRSEPSLALLRRSLQIRRAALGPFHPAVGLTLRALVNLYCQRRRWDLAQTACQDLRQLLEANLAKNHPDITALLKQQAQIYQSAGADDRAQEYLKLAAERETLQALQPT